MVADFVYRISDDRDYSIQTTVRPRKSCLPHYVAGCFINRPNFNGQARPAEYRFLHTFFEAREAHQKLNRFIGIDVPSRLRPQLPVSAPYQSKVFCDGPTQALVPLIGLFGEPPHSLNDGARS
jgi:hypothetical protein